MTLNPATSEPYLTASSYKAGNPIDIPVTTPSILLTEAYTPGGVVYNKWTEILTGAGFTQPITGTPVYEGGGGGGSSRPSSGFLYPRGN